jgi:hypothetical protein
LNEWAHGTENDGLLLRKLRKWGALFLGDEKWGVFREELLCEEAAIGVVVAMSLNRNLRLTLLGRLGSQKMTV